MHLLFSLYHILRSWLIVVLILGTVTVHTKYNQDCICSVDLRDPSIHTLLKKMEYVPCRICEDILNFGWLSIGMDIQSSSHKCTHFYRPKSNRIQLFNAVYKWTSNGWYVKIFDVKSNMQQQAPVTHKKSNMGENNAEAQRALRFLGGTGKVYKATLCTTM